MINSSDLQIFIGDKPIGISKPVTLPLISEEWIIVRPTEGNFEYYYRRRNYFYFRNETGKLRLELKGKDLKKMINMKFKRHQIVEAKWSYD